MIKYIEIRVKSELNEEIVSIICDTRVEPEDECVERAIGWLKYAVSNT